MAATQPTGLGVPAKLVLVLAAALIVLGIVWHGVTVATFQRIWHDMVERPDGPVSFRFILQPAMAALAGFRQGLQDARSGHTPYFASMLRERQNRVAHLRDGVNATARIVLLGIVMDMIYQALVLKTFYPNEALIIALMLAVVPYVVVRGLTGRIARHWYPRTP
ncbi:hypothetical protein GXW78_13690 [Roseomonas terrae]|uniref:Glycosyl-4,4'-diaponeurosporenoate acyltransferase n=1 Tax=Neoroseomonas terrae TaxID=424799 RepID=A0ABS5EI77_9PROT|nr:hypothetical protein [Neoroseomonas terrae]MBR0650724.1 hypothetical protein [Neoroseomonas terrae]